jgi:hypothetical protein
VTDEDFARIAENLLLGMVLREARVVFYSFIPSICLQTGLYNRGWDNGTAERANSALDLLFNN